MQMCVVIYVVCLQEQYDCCTFTFVYVGECALGYYILPISCFEDYFCNFGVFVFLQKIFMLQTFLPSKLL